MRFIKNKDGELLLEYPPQRRTIIIRYEDTHYSRIGRVYQLPFPYMVFKGLLSQNLTNLTLGVSNQQQPADIFCVPLPNIIQGSVCLGRYALPRQIINEEILLKLANIFWTTDFYAGMYKDFDSLDADYWRNASIYINGPMVVRKLFGSFENWSKLPLDEVLKVEWPNRITL